MTLEETPNGKVKLRIENLTKIFGEPEQTQQALRMLDKDATKDEILEATGATVGVNKASFDIYEGEIFVIMGLSGSGKSTLVRMLNRLIEPTAGNVYINEDNISKMSEEELREIRRKEISMVFQNFGLFPHRTILENAEYGLEVQGVEKDVRRKAAEQALENAGLLPYKDQYPDQLSGGMQQRVGLARALANDPEVLLMDEAFSALDPLIRRDMQDELIELQEKDSRTIVFITHDLNEALRIGDRIVIMRHGEVVQVGTGGEILQNPENDYVERFVEDVDRARVYTAEDIMESPQPLIIGVHTPEMALQQMKADDLSNMLVIDTDNHLQGYVLLEDMVRAAGEGEGVNSLEDYLYDDITKISPAMLISEMYDVIYDTNTPLAVVDRKERLKGIVVRSSVITALAKDTEEGSDVNE